MEGGEKSIPGREDVKSPRRTWSGRIQQNPQHLSSAGVERMLRWKVRK